MADSRGQPIESSIVTYRTRWSPLTVETVQFAPLRPTQLLIRTTYGALNPVDAKIKAVSVWPMRHRVGRDFCGVVEEVGSELTDRYAVGDRVCGKLGDNEPSYVGTRTIVEPDSTDVVMKPPPRLSDEEAAAFPVVFGAAWELLESGDLGPDSVVLILGGATSVGAFAIQIAKLHYKVRKVVVTASTRSTDYVRQFGADEVLDYRRHNIRSLLVDSAKYNGKFQGICDCAGGYDALAVWPEILQPIERGSFYATIIGDSAPKSTYSQTIWGNLSSGPRMILRLLFGWYLGINYKHIYVSKSFWVFEAPRFFANPKVRIPIDSVYPLQDFKQAWNRVESARARGKVLIEF